jgi:SAM-dependent methyltransferase
MTNNPTDPSNAQQATAWDGNDGAFWASHADEFDRSLSAYRRPLLDAAGIRPSDHVLDVGCGTGQITRDAARLAGAGTATGVDLSARMIEEARGRAARENLVNVRFEQADAQVHPFDDVAFDLALSRMGAMFFGQPEAAFTNVARALGGGGRLVMLTWQALDRNDWAQSFLTALAAGRELPAPLPGAPGPFSLSDPDRVHHVLHRAGFTDVVLEGIEAPMLFGKSPEEAVDFVLGTAAWLLEELDDERREYALGQLRRTVEAHYTRSGVIYDAAAWLITGRRP